MKPRREESDLICCDLQAGGMGDESRVTQAIGRVQRERQPALQRLKRRLEQICENNNGEAETSGNYAFRDCPFYGAEAAAKSRKSRKNREEHDGEPGRHPALAWPAQRILLELELRGAEIDQQAVLDPTGTQVAQDWGHLLLLISSIVDFSFASFAPLRGREAFPTCPVRWHTE